jgi:acyl carrier protein
LSLVWHVTGVQTCALPISDVPDSEDLRLALDIDSIGFLDFIIALHARTGVDIPEIDYPKLTTRAGLLDYQQARGGQKTT